MKHIHTNIIFVVLLLLVCQSDVINILNALESVMCDVIKIRLKRGDATRSNIKLKLHLKFGNPSFKIGRSTAVLIFSGWPI